MVTNMKTIFWFSIITGTLITISSKSWISMWMGLEINLLAFISLVSNSTNQQTSEATLKYFLVQSLASSMFIFWIILNFIYSEWFLTFTENLNSFSISMILALKLGAAPFHFWFPPTSEGFSWNNCMILLTWQKLAPLFILMTINSLFLIYISILSALVGAVGIFNQSSLRKLMAYSSINHLGWMLAIILINESLTLVYFSIYCLLAIIIMFLFNHFKIIHINQIKNTNNPMINILLMLNLMSLGGLPPFLGFMPKWLTINFLVMYNHFILPLILVVSTLITLYVYIRLMYSSLTISTSSNQWFTPTLNSLVLMVGSISSIISLPIMVNFII